MALGVLCFHIIAALVQKTEALSQMEKASGRRACNIKVSKNVFKQAYLGRTGSSVIAARLFDLQEPGAPFTTASHGV